MGDDTQTTYWLVVWNMTFIFFHILGMSSSQLINIFQRGRYTTKEYPTEIHPLLIFHPNQLGKGFRLIVAFTGRPLLFELDDGNIEKG